MVDIDTHKIGKQIQQDKAETFDWLRVRDNAAGGPQTVKSQSCNVISKMSSRTASLVNRRCLLWPWIQGLRFVFRCRLLLAAKIFAVVNVRVPVIREFVRDLDVVQ